MVGEVGSSALPETYRTRGHRRELENRVCCPLLAGFCITETSFLKRRKGMNTKFRNVFWGFFVPLHASSWVVRTFLISLTHVVFTSAVGA